MSELKEIYAIEWMGPYDSIEEIGDREGSEDCFVYLITGRFYHNGPMGIRYVGITKRFVGDRLKDKDHQKKQTKLKNKQFWTGRFSVSAYNNLDTEVRRNRAEKVETLLVRYLTNVSNIKMINDKKVYSDPKKLIGIVNRWQKKYTEEGRYNKPSILSKLPDTLFYVDKEFFAGDKLKLRLYTP
ncbi:MAG: hypothetical protein IKG83_06595 [Prevotella sp.]|nr:hypothetical protein [Prevotella sp.]